LLLVLVVVGVGLAVAEAVAAFAQELLPLIWVVFKPSLLAREGLGV
jgi:hypothetical protein